MLHRILRSNSLSMIVSEHTVKEVECFLRDQALIHVVDKLVPGLLLVHAEDVVVVAVQGDVVLLNIIEQIIRSQNLSDFNQLVVVIFSLEERLLLKNHTSKHTSK